MQSGEADAQPSSPLLLAGSWQVTVTADRLVADRADASPARYPEPHSPAWIPTAALARENAPCAGAPARSLTCVVNVPDGLTRDGWAWAGAPLHQAEGARSLRTDGKLRPR